jgi:radical SAM protein with 4Fe4S-binding SPASM domain
VSPDVPTKAFLEITNACNLACDFCHGTKREIKYLTVEEFTRAATEARKFADYLYFHLMGEPLLHPKLAEFFEIAGNLGFKVVLTTNGTLLDRRRDVLLNAKCLHKVSISLHSYEANQAGQSVDEYLDNCFRFCRDAADRGIVAVMRLWNLGGKNSLNEMIIAKMHAFFDESPDAQWREIFSGYKLKDRLFLEWGEKFDWPDENADEVSDSHSCHGLRDQIGILSDGTVVPCCLDADGAINLGNIFDQPLEEILSSKRVENMRKAFDRKVVTERLCRRCGYAHMKKFK